MAVRDRVGAHRERMRAQGFRLVQTWVPDVRAHGFASAAHTQSLAVAAAEQLSDDQNFVEAVSVDWTEVDRGEAGPDT
ncbi:MAG: antitoxin MazE family protein [Salinibacterium sp.]|nr:antitoxin MazE family protein [Salinibacterium sp.]